jgi:hypothetical protein
MEQKNIDTILETMAEKIRDLEFELKLREYDFEKAKEEAEKAAEENLVLRSEITRLAEKVAYLECGSLRER